MGLFFVLDNRTRMIIFEKIIRRRQYKRFLEEKKSVRCAYYNTLHMQCTLGVRPGYRSSALLTCVPLAVHVPMSLGLHTIQYYFIPTCDQTPYVVGMIVYYESEDPFVPRRQGSPVGAHRIYACPRKSFSTVHI